MNMQQQTSLVLPLQFVLPDSQNFPAALAKRAVYNTIPSLVSGEFFPPESAVAFWLRSVLRASVPETTVHKDCEPYFVENKIRFTENFLIPPPAGDFVLPE